VRELAHALEHAVLFAPQERIDLPHLPTHLSQPAPAAAAMPDKPLAPSPAEGAAAASGLSLHEVMKDTLLRSLKKTGGNRRRAASLLGVSRSTLYRMLDRYGIGTVGRGPEGTFESHEKAQMSAPKA
jgi:transcriptional regulator of acetoin/glycerol metabolism